MKKLKRIVAFIVGWIDLEIILVAIFSVGYPKSRAWSMLLTTILWVWPAVRRANRCQTLRPILGCKARKTAPRVFVQRRRHLTRCRFGFARAHAGVRCYL